MTVLVLSEGARDVGNLAEGKQGAVAVLVRRLLSEAWGREVKSWEVETDVLKRIHEGKGFERKADLAVTEAQIRRYRAVIIVVDRDGPRNTTRLDALRRGRDEARGKGKPLAEKLARGKEKLAKSQRRSKFTPSPEIHVECVDGQPSRCSPKRALYLTSTMAG